MSAYAAVVLAAGLGSRFHAAGGRELTKLLATLRGTPLVRHVVIAAIHSQATPVILVTGHASGAVMDAVADLPLTAVHNPGYAEGLAGSLKAGIAAVPAACDGAVVLLADMPGIGSGVIDALVTRATGTPEADAIVPVFAGRPGNPVLLTRRLFPAVASLTGDVGARHLLRDITLRVEDVPLPDRGIILDVDRPIQLGRLRGRHDGVPFTIC